MLKPASGPGRALLSLPSFGALLGALLGLGPGTGGVAWAGPPGLRLPERVTAGWADQFLGAPTPAGRHLYFVSNQNATTEIFQQDGQTGAARPLFDEMADVTWPRVSPDGRQLLYISYRDDALGDLCLRDLSRDPGKESARRCLEGPGIADLQALWLPGGDLAVVRRQALHSDLSLRRVHTAPGGLRDAGPLHPGAAGLNLSAPAVSPDGRWLVFVPLERAAGITRVGISFAARAAGALGLLRLDAAGAKPQRLRFNLPGTTGMPAISADGRHLYFTQYLNDTNLDGATDGNDHGVLFRVPFDAGRDEPLDAAARPEQLTSAGWNCQYPVPTADHLIATCAQRGALAVYRLPLSGSVPADWDEARLTDEVGATQDPWERLLLYGHLLARKPAGPAQVPLLLQMIRLHLGLGEYGSAAFYTEQVARHGDPGQRGLAAALRELIDHRRDERAIDRGQLSARFVAAARERLSRLQGIAASPAAVALAAVVQSEIYDDIGEKEEAAARLSGVPLGAGGSVRLSEPFVLHAAGERAADLHRARSDREALGKVYRQLAEHPALGEEDRLRYAGRLVQELSRGRDRSALPAILQTYRQEVMQSGPEGQDGEIAYLLELEGWLLQLTPEAAKAEARAEQVRKGVFDLYRRHKSLARRRALITATILRAAAVDSAYLTYQFANTWVSGLPLTRAERRYAEQLYRQVVNDRAYISLSEGNIGDARGSFYGVTLQTDSLEAHVGFLETALREGKTEAALRAQIEERFKDPGDPVRAFALGHLQGREGAAQEERLQQALLQVRTAAGKLPLRAEVHHLWANLSHRRFLRSQETDQGAAQEATTHYLLALDLSRENPRYRAASLSGLAHLQAAVGNHHQALGALAERERLPFPDPEGALAHQVIKGRSLFHVGQAKQAAARLDEALALLEKDARLGRYRPLLLDRAALYHLAAGDAARARALAVAETPLLTGENGGAGNLFKNRLLRGAAALGAGQAKESIADLLEAERLLGGTWLKDEEARAGYRITLLGLRAQAQRDTGDLDGALKALAGRREALLLRYKRHKTDEDLLELARAQAQLAVLSLRKGDGPGAVRHAEEGLLHSDAFSKRTGTQIHETGTGLLLLYAGLHHDRGVSLSAYRQDLAGRLREAYRLLCQRRNPAWREATERIGAYLTLHALAR